MLRRILIVSALFSLFTFFSSAQVPSPLIFSRLTKKEGLASNTIFRTVQDKQGFLWIATQNGLQRYDGNRFLTFRHTSNNASSIPANNVSYVFIDSKGHLWVLFDKQLGTFNTNNFTFNEATIDSSVTLVKKIMEDDKGRIILFADDKIFVYNETQHSFVSLYPLPALPPGYTITDMRVIPSTGLYWFTGNQGSLLYDLKTKHFFSKEQNNIHDPVLDGLGPIKDARYPFIAEDGTWWIVSWVPFMASAPSVLYSYDKKKNKLMRFEKIRPYKADSYYEIWNIFQQSNGTIWVYGMGLLAYYNQEEKRFIHIKSDPFQQNGIDYDFVTSLYEDREKNVWVCTNNGLYRFNTEAQVFLNVPNKRFNDTTVVSNAVSAIVQTQNSGIWVSTWGGGIFSYNNELQPIPNPVTHADPKNKSLHASYMLQGRNGEIWIGTQTGELKIYDPSTKKYFSVAPSLLKGQVITQLLEDSSGSTWIGTADGLLMKCENGNWADTTHSFKTILSDVSDILRLYEDSSNHLWVCTATKGVYELNIDGHILRQLKENADKNAGLLNDGATDIVQYNDSIFLIASDGLCILNSRTNTFRYLPAGDGLPTEHITALVVDKQKRLWVAVDGGLYRLNIDSRLYVMFDATDGIVDDQFQVASAAVLHDGRIAIGTAHNFLVFDPEKTINRMEVPPARIAGFTLGTSNLLIDSLHKLDKIRLPYDNTFITVELSTLTFHDQYYLTYMLAGLDKTWKTVNNNEISYQYLPPGNYMLKLKSMSGEGTESKKITTLHIQVNSPFWQTWWFYSLLVLLVGGLLFWFDHERIKRKTAILEMRSNIADDLHYDIDATLNQITILSQMAKMKADREPQKSKEFIEEINTKSQNMARAMDDILWGINPNNDSMENFMLRFSEHIDALKNQYNIQIDVLIDKKAENLPLKMKMRNDVFSLFKSGITNMVRLGGENCRIHITYEKPNLVYTLEFDTTAMDIKQLTNIRLRTELSGRLEKLNATLDFKEYKTNAAFVLSIPVKSNGL